MAPRKQLLLLLCVLANHEIHSFVSPHLLSKNRKPLYSSGNDDATSTVQEEWEAFERAQLNLELMEALVQPKQSLVEISLVGQAKLPTATNKTDTTRTPCLVVSRDENSKASCLLIPVEYRQLKLLSFAYQNKSLSKSVMLGINPLLVNRDGGLFDNLPWATWTVDPQLRNRDAASNLILDKYHMGKRDAFAKFGGKDWKGRSISIGNLATRLKYMLETQTKDTKQPNEEEDASVLTKRILALKLQEIQDDLAETEYQLAIARNNGAATLFEWENQRDDLTRNREEAKETIAQLDSANNPQSWISSILDKIADSTTQGDANAAPYRGATGYAPLLDSEDDLADSMLPYTSPFDLMREILQDQLQARVIGALLENTSLLDGTLTVGGAILLQRLTPKQTMTINGETVSIDDEERDFGNDGIVGGETILVECDVDEALGMALTTNVPIQIESEIWDRSSISGSKIDEETSKHVMDQLALWEPADSSFSFLMEGQAKNQSVTEKTSALRIPRTTTDFEAFFEPSSSSQVFPTDNPIKSLGEYDALTQSDKAQTLLELSNFNSNEKKLPRPRVLRIAKQKSNGISPDPLDELLLPLIDESVRRQYLIRDAEIRQDWETVRELESQKSRRQIALENAEEAREMYGDESLEALQWEEEAERYSNLRADVTQDEGSYSRFLDKDDWYEENNRNRAKRLNKKTFGTLLDGIE